MSEAGKKGDRGKHGERGGTQLQLAAIGMEAEFQVVVDGAAARPEDVFGTPRAFLSGEVMHRVGTSYHLPNGCAVYFDTGVIEVATPVIEIERGCAARAGRSLWEGILHLRADLDRWERRTGRRVRLVGFSTHYNISFELPPARQGSSRTVEKLALLLSYILPVPVMMLAANRRSTGIGVRPRGDRIEVTADFTPSASLMIATATLITGMVRAVMAWPTFELAVLAEKQLPVLRDYAPMPHTSRKGWLARLTCFPHNPFGADVDRPAWATRDGRTLSLRTIAGLTVRHFWHPIRRISDPFTFRLIGSVIRGRAPSLLDLDDRPPEYEDVGRLCTWDNLFPESELSRSRYERVLIRAISGQQLTLGGARYTPTGMQGWAQVVFRREGDRTRHVLAIDYLIDHLRDWERSSTRGG